MITSIAFIFVFSSLLAQHTMEQVTPSLRDINLNQSFLKKSKEQKAGAILLLLGGVTMMAIGAGSAAEDMDLNLSLWSTSGPEPAQKNQTGMGLFIAGGVTTLSSIPLFIAAGRNKRKAQLVSGSQTSMVAPDWKIKQTTVGLAIPMGR
ncbi:MAG TPA: hypothetical protein VGN63_16300 [Flavisolibacter sp.]|jgi:hypothetical protein|nr:hypothetical protein [Flavisolibacter sp.]